MKLFKKIFPVLVLALCAGFSSCEKEDDGNDPTALIGTWNYASTSYDVQTSIPAVTAMLKEQFQSDEDMKGISLTFNADKSYSFKSSDGDVVDSGTYTANNGTLTVKSTEGNETLTYSISGSKLTITSDEDLTNYANMSTLYPGLKITKVATTMIFNKK